MSIMFLDIVTIPDFDLGAKLYNLQGLSEKDIARVMATKNRETGNDTDVLPPHMQRVLAISVLFQDKDSIKIWSVGDAKSNEGDLLKILWRYADEYKPAVISWCGDKTIFPVLNFRYISHRIQLPAFTSYTSLLTELAGAGNMENISLHEAAMLAGSPGNNGMSHEDVMKKYLQDEVESVRNNLEMNLIDTWMIYQSWQLVNDKTNKSALEEDRSRLIKTLRQENRTHLEKFAEALV